MIQEAIITAERQWLGRTYDYCRSCFAGLYLPSHDETHHLRVWHYARQLIPLLPAKGILFNAAEVEGVLLASLLHDTGMAETFSPAHGAAGRRLAERFFSSCPVPPHLTEEILDAIEKHDDKAYREQATPATPGGRILLLLSVADDLDAFGYTGVFRYYEIYSLRGISVAQDSEKILRNLDHRFEHMLPYLPEEEGLLNRHRQRYRITRAFFEDLGGRRQEEALQVLRFLDEKVLQPRHRPEDLQAAETSAPENPYLHRFITEMIKELNPER